MIISIDVEETFNKYNILSCKKISKLCIDETFLNRTKAIFEKPIASIIQNGESWMHFDSDP